MTFFEELEKAAQAHGEAEHARALAQGFGPVQSELIAAMEQRVYISGWLWEQLAALDASSTAAQVAAVVALYPRVAETATGSDRDALDRALAEAMRRVQGGEA